MSVLRLAPADSHDPESRGFGGANPSSNERGNLPYRVELWNEPRTSVEQTLAVTVNASLGYAAYFAATRDFPDRHVTLRFRDTILSRWNGPTH